MSADALKRAAAHRLSQRREEIEQELVTRTSDTESQMRLNQGRIQGLNEALVELDEAYKKLG